MRSSLEDESTTTLLLIRILLFTPEKDEDKGEEDEEEVAVVTMKADDWTIPTGVRESAGRKMALMNFRSYQTNI